MHTVTSIEASALTASISPAAGFLKVSSVPTATATTGTSHVPPMSHVPPKTGTSQVPASVMAHRTYQEYKLSVSFNSNFFSCIFFELLPHLLSHNPLALLVSLFDTAEE